MSKLSVYNEYGKLRKVMVGPANTLPPYKPINEIQRYYYPSSFPKLDLLIAEHKKFVDTLEANGVEVIFAVDIPGCDQRDIRDIGIVVNSKFLVCRVIEKTRECEVRGLEDLLTNLDFDEKVFCEDGYIEGGDIIIEGDTLYIGIGKRTNEVGFELIKKRFGNKFNVIPLPIVDEHSHLDTIFNVFSPGLAIMYPQGLKEETRNILNDRYQVIKVTEEEQFQLATNILAVSPSKVIMDAERHPRIAGEIQKKGLKILNVGFSETNKIGGSFRCGSLPLFRDKEF